MFLNPFTVDDLVTLLVGNARLQGTPRPLIEVIAEESVKALDLKLQGALRNAGMIIRDPTPTRPCVFCGFATPVAYVARDERLSQSVMCSDCKSKYHKCVTAVPVTSVLREEGVPPVYKTMDSLFAPSDTVSTEPPVEGGLHGAS